MSIGVFDQHESVNGLVESARDVAARGFGSFWVPQIFGLDAITALAVVAHEVPTIEIGTAVVPTYPRHPMMMAAQSLTLQQISGGRFTLGIGLSHQIVIDSMLGMSFDKPVRHLREYLSILIPLLQGEASDFTGETLTAKLSLGIPDAPPVPVLVAALGSQMLKLAGTRTEGTITWMTGPATIESHVGPAIREAAAAAGRPEPRIVAALPVCVTDDPDAERERAAKVFAMYGYLPSYRAMLDLEGAAGPANVAIVGDAATVVAGIERVMDAGATDFVAVPFANRHDTLDVVASLL
ncbi:MAG: LLM class F420-dependent oxidoreductase [Acidimicrobiia bacterium]|nr:LLM class F420-dependent oxidoreductase [Acidimicrobiia bacterium]